MADSKLRRLMEQREAIDALIKKEQYRHKSEERKREDRRKYLAGAMVLQWAARDNEFSVKLTQGLKVFLVRDADRALFGLPLVGNPQPDAPAIPNRAA